MLWRAEEWETESGFHCNCISNLGQDSAAWYLPARILDLTPAQFIELLITKFKPDDFYFNPKTCFCCWSWKDQSKMRLYKNWLNAEARKKNFQI